MKYFIRLFAFILVLAMCFTALGTVSYAATLNVSVADDGRNFLASSAEQISFVTPTDATITIGGITSLSYAEVGIRVKSTSDGKTVYVYQDKSDKHGNFEFSFAVDGFLPDTYEINISTQAMAEAEKRYFTIAPPQVPVGASDVFDCFTVNGRAVQFDKSKVAVMTMKPDELYALPAIDISTVDKTATVDVFPSVPQKIPCALRVTVTFDDGEKKVYSLVLNEDRRDRSVTNLVAPYGASKYVIEDSIKLGTSVDDASLVYNDRNNVYWHINSSKIFEGATQIKRAKSDTNGATSENIASRPYYGGAYSGQNGEPYWMSFTVGANATVYMADRHAAGWPNNDGTWKTDSAYTISISGSSVSGKHLYYKNVKAGETVYVPNYGMKEGWPAEGITLWDPPTYVIVWDSNGSVEGTNADLSEITYSLDGGETQTLVGFSPDNDTYILSVPEGTTSVTFDVAKSDSDATVSADYDATLDFDGEELTKQIRVVSAGGIVEKTYNITVKTRVGSWIWGDVNVDGEIDVLDAIYILRYGLELSLPDGMDMTAGDVNIDGSVDTFDAIYVLRYGLELSVPDNIRVGQGR